MDLGAAWLIVKFSISEWTEEHNNPRSTSY
jgi:hypothetical protein